MKSLKYAFVTVVAVVSALATFIPANAAVTPPWDPFFADQQTAASFGATTRPFGVAAGDYDEDGDVDLVVGRTTGNVHWVEGNGDGTFQAPTTFTWKQPFFNAWSFAAGDVNEDGWLDVVWSANAAIGSIADGDVRVWFGNGDGTFVLNPNVVSGVTYNAGTRLADIGTDAGSVAAGDINADGMTDVVAGAVEGVKVLRVTGCTAGAPTASTTCTVAMSSISSTDIYFPATSTQNSPWGLAMGDADGDGDVDLFVGDRALYVYLYRNDGTGAFTLKTGNTGVPATRTNAYLDHDSFRAAVGYTPSLGAGDINGDGKADLVVGLHSGTQLPSTNIVNDGLVLLNLSSGATHTSFGPLADIGTMARGITVADGNADGYLDVFGSAYDGQVQYLRQLEPVDSDSDGVSDYVDNAPNVANAARIDMNADGSINHRDQLDNDFDTVLGDPENQASWQRLGDPADADDDNDGVSDGADNCPFVPNTDQVDADQAVGSDTFGDACDPLDNRDPDGDGVPTGPMPGDPLYDEALAAKIKWSEGDTHFVIRIDALGRFFQNEFTQIMTDAATLSPADWETKCWENYGAGDPADPCGTGEETVDQALTLPGGKEVPVTVITIPKQLWSDPPVIDWINDRNDSERFDLGMHATYHASNTANGDWAGDPAKNFFSCELCGLTEAESLELLRVGYDTLVGNYDNKWVAESGATGSSPKIDWTDAATPLLSYAPPFNADDPIGRKAVAQLGFKAHSSSVFEEGELGGIGQYFTPEGSHHEQFDQWGLFHASADLELEPPDTTGDTYDPVAYEDYLEANTDDGGLTTWLIEEVEWSGRPCQNDDRLGTCNGGSNRENNTVYLPRWNGWMQLLDYVNSYPGGVAMTMAEVALAKGFDNAPTVANPGQADADSDGVGDVIDDASLAAADGSLSRNEAGTLSATLTNGVGDPIADQEVTFSFDADGDAVDEEYTATTDASGIAEATVTPTRPVGPATFTADWDGVRATDSDSGDLSIADATTMTLDETNPTSGQVTDDVMVGATLEDSSGDPLPGQTVSFSIGSASGSGTTDGDGHAEATLTLAGPAGAQTLQASFAGAGLHGTSSHTAAFTVNKEDTTLALANAVATKNDPAVANATLTQDGLPLAGKTVEFFVQEKVKNQIVYTSIGTAATNASGVASKEIPSRFVSKQGRPIRATFAGDADYLGSTGNASATRA